MCKCCCCSGDKVVDEKVEIIKIEDLRDVTKRPNEENQRKEWICIHEDLEKKSNLFEFVRAKSKTSFTNLNSQIDYLKSAPVNSVLERAYLVFIWLKINYAENKISLDCSRRIANEFEQLCVAFDIKCQVIEGYAKYMNTKIGHRFRETNHAWNAFKYNDFWYYVDVVWAAKKQRCSFHANYWFMTPPYIFHETHFSIGPSINQNFDINQFEEMHVNQLEYHILGLKCKNFPNSLIQCFSNPFFVELTSKELIDLSVSLKNDRNNEKKNYALIQKGKSMDNENNNEYKYCVIFYIESNKDSKHTLSLTSKNREKNSKVILSTYYINIINDQFPTNLPQYNLLFDCNIELTSHKSLVLFCELDYLNIEFWSPSSTMIMGLLKNFDESKEAELTKMAQITQNDGSKNMVFSVFPNTRLSWITFSYSVDSDKTYKEFVKFFVLKKYNEKEIIREMVKIDPRNEDFFIFSPLEYYLKLNEVCKFRYYFRNAQSVKLCDTEGKFVDLERKSGDLFEKEFRVEKPGSLKVFVKQANQTVVLVSYLVGDFYTSKVNHIQSFRNLLN